MRTSVYKKMLLLFVSFFILLISNAQIVSKSRHVVQIMPQQTLYLNGGMRAITGGKSRTYYEINLPSNTIEWYYIFTTSKGQSEKVGLDLVAQLTKLVDPTGLSKMAVSAITAPTGAMVCDVYLMDRQNADAFLEKSDNWGGSYRYIVSGSRENYRNGIVQVQGINQGRIYLGFKNPSPSEGVAVSFEVAAIIEETDVDNTAWSAETKDRFYKTMFAAIKKQISKVDIAQKVTSCLIENLTAQKTPEEYDAMPTYERTKYVEEIYSKCAADYLPKPSPDQDKAINYGNLGWKAYEAGDVEKCMELTKKALALDSSIGVFKANYALCLLIKGEEDNAMEYYMGALEDFQKEDRATAKTYIKATIEDMRKAQKKYPSVKENGYLKELFESELKKYR